MVGQTAGGAILIEMHSSPGAVRSGLRRVMRSLPVARISDDGRSSVEIVLAEVLNNVVEHAYAGGQGMIRLWIRHDRGCLCCRVEDEGIAMPQGRLPAPPLGPAGGTAAGHGDGGPGRGRDPVDLAARIAEGGFGWFMIRQLVDDLDYQRLGAMNRLSFRVPPADGVPVAG